MSQVFVDLGKKAVESFDRIARLLEATQPGGAVLAVTSNDSRENPVQKFLEVATGHLKSIDNSLRVAAISLKGLAESHAKIVEHTKETLRVTEGIIDARTSLLEEKIKDQIASIISSLNLVAMPTVAVDLNGKTAEPVDDSTSTLESSPT